MYKLSGMLLSVLAVSACTVAPVQHHDYSKMPQDVFTDVVKKVRGNTRHVSRNLAVGYRLSATFINGLRRDEIEALFRANDGGCSTLPPATVMNCSTTRWWTYTADGVSPDLGKVCEPGMQLVYGFYFDEPRNTAEVISEFDFTALNLSRCPYAPAPPSAA